LNLIVFLSLSLFYYLALDVFLGGDEDYGFILKLGGRERLIAQIKSSKIDYYRSI
jgi:hypothetical protein